LEIELCVEADEQWSFVQNKKQQRRLWYAREKRSKKVLGFVFGRRTDEMFRVLLAKLFNITHYDTDDWQSYSKYLPSDKHTISKSQTQNIERENLNFRTHLKRLARNLSAFGGNDMFLKINPNARHRHRSLS
jgi:insertion element IS1 protein InsB